MLPVVAHQRNTANEGILLGKLFDRAPAFVRTAVIDQQHFELIGDTWQSLHQRRRQFRQAVSAAIDRYNDRE